MLTPAETQAMQRMYDDLFDTLCRFTTPVHPGEAMRDARIREVELYAMLDRLEEGRMFLGLQAR